jgi:hypothetical protein
LKRCGTGTACDRKDKQQDPPVEHDLYVSLDDICKVRLDPEAEILDVIGTKVLRVFLLAVHSHLY